MMKIPDTVMPYSAVPTSMTCNHGNTDIDDDDWPQDVPLDVCEKTEILEEVYNTDKNSE
jgi:hypothetical protein